MRVVMGASRLEDINGLRLERYLTLKFGVPVNIKQKLDLKKFKLIPILYQPRHYAQHCTKLNTINAH